MMGDDFKRSERLGRRRVDGRCPDFVPPAANETRTFAAVRGVATAGQPVYAH